MTRATTFHHTKHLRARKSDTRTARKQCAKCHTIGWYQPKERRCKIQRFGPKSYWCYGTLIDAPIHRRAATTSVVDAPLPSVLLDVERGAAHRRNAERKLDAVRRRMDDSKQTIDRVLDDAKRKVARLRRLLAKQQRDERKWAKEAVMTDDQLGARRERARHAAQVSAKVQRVRRRLSASASMFEDADAAADKLRLRLARKRVHRVLMQRARRRRAQTRAAARP